MNKEKPNLLKESKFSSISNLRMGIDVGSTTVKVAVLSADDTVILSDYQRHKADIRSTIIAVVSQIIEKIIETSPQSKNQILSVKVTGSGGLAVSKWLSIPFIQEVIAATTAVQKLIPQTDVAIELGGEDAKITYFTDNVEQRMNGTCAGGTGAFIDQMAALLETDATGLNDLAKGASTIYPIAARCGVFAKTDVQPLINEGAKKQDIAASIFQAVVSQTISGLACGKPIRGKIAFLGGPLHFLDQLRERFIETLQLKEDEIIIPHDSQLFVAMGAAFSAEKIIPLVKNEQIPFVEAGKLLESLKTLVDAEMTEIQRLDPLFHNQQELDEFNARHDKEKAITAELKTANGPVFLGLDAGSTTTKAILIDKNGSILWRFYDVNAGNPVELAVTVLKNLYTELPSSVYIARSLSTGYGEALFQAALGVDAGEVETIAHFKAADFFVPNVEFLLDIGGQDMKCLRMKNGAITSIQLNEACSSGCGSFLDNFARSLGMDIQSFSTKALLAKKPVDLGSRCTVFMNSRVKQAQKEGATVADISAGLSYSVIKNALFKVIKLRRLADIGSKVVVQGGTFKNNAVLRAFEKVSGINAFRPDIAGLMGAYGAALIARDQWIDEIKKHPDIKTAYLQGISYEEILAKEDLPKITSRLAGVTQLNNFKTKLNLQRCKKCSNNCLLTINTFSNNDEKKSRSFITGNRCERGLELEDKNIHVFDASNSEAEDYGMELPNLYEWKYKRLFNYKPLDEENAPRGIIGIPRVLNMYENYPLWFTFFTKLGFRVVISPRSNRHVYEMGLESIPSESVCYPGKITHGHVEALLKQKVKHIFYPCAPYEIVEDKGAGNHYNCPIVTSYPEVLRNNIEALRQDESIHFYNPFLPIDDKERLAIRLFEELGKVFNLTQQEVTAAVEEGWDEQQNFRKEMQDQGEEALEQMIRMGANGIVLAGRPYHIDPEINHGIPEMIVGLGLTVLTEDSIAHLGEIERPLRIVDQWTYHNRLYRAGIFASGLPSVEIIQLTSFGCGLDAVTADQVEDILAAKKRMYTLIKIDEGSNLGAVRIRIRSLIAAAKERGRLQKERIVENVSAAYDRAVFKKEMRGTHTILAPQMSPLHFRFVQTAFRLSGYNFVILPDVDTHAVDTGLQYVNNDACYPTIIVVGQMIAALKSGQYDLNHTSLLITQTGGGCRATNYIGFIRRALIDAGWGHIPVISLNVAGLESNPGFKMTLPLIQRAMMALMIGDLLMRVIYRTRPYEAVKGSVNALHEKWKLIIDKRLEHPSFFNYHRTIKQIVKEFDSIELIPVRKARVGVVGEILVKFHPTANNDIFTTIENEGAECVVPDLADFFFYTFATGIYRHEKLSFPKKTERNARFLVWFLELYRAKIKKELKKSKRFEPPKS
ncbi:MAG: acyl-CoA dehydratase activase-related protein, partial [Treponemataceae bacterium]